MITTLIFATLMVNIIILYFVYDSLKQQSKIVDKDDFMEYAKITKQKFDNMYSDIKVIKESVYKAKTNINSIYDTMLDERVDRKDIIEQIREITTQLQSIFNTVDKFIEDRAKLKASLIYTKRRIKELKKELRNVR